MAMTREEMQRLASQGRGGDTMLAHINPQEAALLKSQGGSGTINPNTGLPEFKFGGWLAQKAQEVAAPFVQPLEKAGGQITSNLPNLIPSIENTVKQVAANPIAQVALAYYMPGISSYLTGPLIAAGVPAAYASAVATALASTALQTAQGVPFETALQNASVNAITNTGAPIAAQYVNALVPSEKVADIITSIGVSAAKTAATGGSKDDIEKNMVAALTGSGLTSALQSSTVTRDVARVAGAAAGGAVTGGTAGAFMGAAGELGSQAQRDAAALEKQKGTKLVSADPSTITDSGDTLGLNIVKGTKEDPTLQDTSIILPSGSAQPQTPTGKQETIPTLAETVVTAKREPTTLQDTDIVLPDVNVTGSPEDAITIPPAEEPPADPTKPPLDKTGVYNPSLFIYGGKYPNRSTLTDTLGIGSSGGTGSLLSARGQGEIESKETGKKRQNVWNEESLRLKDALGV